MKKIIFILLILFLQQLFAKSYKYEISPVVGYTFNDSYIPLDDYPIYGLEIQFNQKNNFFVPELSFYYEKGNYDYINSEEPADEPYIYTQTRDIYTIALHGVHEFQRNNNFLPFFKLGISNRTLVGDEKKLCHSAFLDLGIGTKIYLSQRVALKFESLYMVNYNNKRVNQHISLFGGLNFSFGEFQQLSQKRTIQTKKRRRNIHHKTDYYMLEPIDIKPIQKTIKLQPIVNKLKDSDNDGVIDSIDECLNTPLNVEVNAYGCKKIETFNNDIIVENGIIESSKPQTCLSDIYRKIANLNIKFKYKSFELTQETREALSILSSFLNKNSDYHIKIIGYTDNIASRYYNQKLSEKRAYSIEKYLIETGIQRDRIIALGLGEQYPVATNTTEVGRAKNRRIELILLKQ